MRRNAIILSILALSGGLAAAGCRRPGAKQEARNAQGTLTSPSAVTPAAPAAAGTVPGELAENLYDAAKIGDWATATAKLDSLRSAILNSAANQSQLEALSTAVAAHDRIAALIASNALTRDFARATASHSPVPVEVVMLDYYGRELEIGAAEGQGGLPRLRSTADSIRSTWDAVRPRVEQRGGAAEAKRFDSLVKGVAEARTPDAYGKLATPILDEVDRLEAVFER